MLTFNVLQLQSAAEFGLSARRPLGLPRPCQSLYKETRR